MHEPHLKVILFQGRQGKRAAFLGQIQHLNVGCLKLLRIDRTGSLLREERLQALGLAKCLKVNK